MNAKRFANKNASGSCTKSFITKIKKKAEVSSAVMRRLITVQGVVITGTVDASRGQAHLTRENTKQKVIVATLITSY